MQKNNSLKNSSSKGSLPKTVPSMFKLLKTFSFGFWNWQFFFCFWDDYVDVEYQQSLEEPEKFWGEIGSQMISWDKMYDQVLDDSSSPFTKWFCGGYLNACFNCVDRHVANGHGNKVALVHDSPITNTVRKVTYQELLDNVS